eukprot:XP_001692114.1 predicted protein [Chlamydomonas reinhardtii]
MQSLHNCVSSARCSARVCSLRLRGPALAARFVVTVRAESSPAETSTSSSGATQPASLDWMPSSSSNSPPPSVVRVMKGGRNVRLLRPDSRSEKRWASFLSAVALTWLAFYGQSIIEQLNQMTTLPIDEIDGIIYFIIAFNIVSLVLPKSRYQ